VKVTARVERWRSLVPKDDSRRIIRRLTALVETPSDRAAAENPPASTTRTNVRNSSRSLRTMVTHYAIITGAVKVCSGSVTYRET